MPAFKVAKKKQHHTQTTLLTSILLNRNLLRA